jgi:hypothetical protein
MAHTIFIRGKRSEIDPVGGIIGLMALWRMPQIDF